MTWCEENDVDYVFGLPGTKPLSKKVDETADDVRAERAVATRTSCAATPRPATGPVPGTSERRAVARIEATSLGLDIRFVVTNLDCGSAEWIYDTLYCARGQAENLIKLHKSAACLRSHVVPLGAVANQVRLVLHTAAYWLMLTVRDAIPKERDLAKAEFATLRLKSAQDRRSRGRNGEPRPLGLRRRLSRGRALRRPTRRAHAARTLNDGAQRPLRPAVSSNAFNSAGLDAVKTTGRQTAFVLNPPKPNPTTRPRHE